MRLFFAVTPPEAQRREIAACVSDLGDGLGGRFTPPQNLHLTLAFLGEVDPDQLPGLEAGAATLSPRPGFDVEWGGLECFPKLRRARVAALGVRQGERELIELARALRRALPESLRPPGNRPFRPHLTVARFREPPPHGLLEALASELAPFSWRTRVAQLELVRSQLASAGARYETLWKVDLAAS